MAHKAFIVGINTLGLRYCERDAQLMSASLERYGYEIIWPEATKGDINDQFDELLDSCSKTDTVVLYFSGHGLVKRGKLSFVLADDLSKSRHKININDLVDTFSDECKAKNKLIILDCCHAGAGIAEWRPDLSDRFFILTASERLEKGKELDALEASFLTHRFQHALNQPPPEIVDTDNTIRVSALYEWLMAEAQRHNSLPNAVQVPLPNLLGNHKAKMSCLDDSEPLVRSFVTKARGQIGDPRGISILRERLSDHDSEIRREALEGLAKTGQDEIDRKLLSRNIDALNPFLDPQEVIGEPQLRRAMLKLKLPMEEVKRRYEALAVRFGLRLGWEIDAVSSVSADGGG